MLVQKQDRDVDGKCLTVNTDYITAALGPTFANRGLLIHSFHLHKIILI